MYICRISGSKKIVMLMTTAIYLNIVMQNEMILWNHLQISFIYFFTSSQNYLSKAWNFTNSFIWIFGPWTPLRSVVSSLKRGRSNSVASECAARGRCALRRKRGGATGPGLGIRLARPLPILPMQTDTTWRTRIVGRRARIQRRT